jgi:NAD(P)-dependent dehydrogenase (short-subunit alcohol dehydrogenase family)
MSSHPWSESSVPSQRGRVVVITGANSGTGFEAARLLAQRGATVVLGCRNRGKAQTAAEALRKDCPETRIEVEPLDLGSLDSIRAAATSIQTRHPKVDLLLNNAGVMVPPYGRTQEGFETQFGTNHLGHYAFTGLLLETLLAAPGSRIVTMSSQAHRMGRIRFDDLNFEKGYKPWPAYGQSKLANLLFTYELQRRLQLAQAGTLALAAHPGWSRTNLQQHAVRGAWTRGFSAAFGALLSQSARLGAHPLVRAAVDPEAQGADYFGPSGFMEMKGHAVRVRSTPRSRDEALQQRLWQVSEAMTGVVYPL